MMMTYSVGNLIMKTETLFSDISSLDQLLCAGHGGENGRVFCFSRQKHWPRTCQVNTFVQHKKSTHVNWKYTI